MAPIDMDREQLQLEAGLISKGEQVAEKETPQTADSGNASQRRSFSLWKLALVVVGLYGAAYVTTAQVWPDYKPCVQHMAESGVKQVERVQSQVKEAVVRPNVDEAALGSSLAALVAKRQATASTPNSVGSSRQQNADTSQSSAPPPTSAQATSSAQQTSTAVPTSSERPVTTTQQTSSNPPPSTSSRPTTSASSSENTSSNQPSTSSRPTTSESRTSSSIPTTSQATSTQQTSSSRDVSSSSRQESTLVSTSTTTSRGSSSSSSSSALPSSSQLTIPATSSTATTSSSSTTTSSEQQTTSSSSSRRTSSSAIPKTFTSTMEGGGVTVITSTSWVEIVPASDTPNSDNPDLQGTAGQIPFGMVMTLLAAFAAGVFLI